MNELISSLIAGQTCDDAVQRVQHRLMQAGLEVVRTFELKEARAAHPEFTCPLHGSQGCDCQMVVLLVYGKDQPPLSLVIHGNNDYAWFDLVDIPQQRADPKLESAVEEAILSIG